MRLLDAINEEIARRADESYERFLRDFLERTIGRPTGSAAEAMRCLKEYRVATVSNLRRLTAGTDDEIFKANVSRYVELMERAGFYENGSGGPRNLREMSENELDALCAEIKKTCPELRERVKGARKIMERKHHRYFYQSPCFGEPAGNCGGW